MGMYDEIDCMVECPKCGYEINGFQSKDGDCRLEHLLPTDPRIESFYSSCPACQEWIVIRKNPPSHLFSYSAGKTWEQIDVFFKVKASANETPTK